VASLECNVARGEDPVELCARLRTHAATHQYLEEEARYGQADCRIVPGTRRLHGPASHRPHSIAAMRSGRGSGDQVVGTNQSDHLANLDAKESPQKVSVDLQ
jgi:hypothetical protein